MPIEIPFDKWPGSVRSVTLGATKADGGTRTRTITVGGQKTLPYMHFESGMPNKPVVAIEIRDRRPEDWSPLLLEAWKDVVDDPVKWANEAEEAGADLLGLYLGLTGRNGNPLTSDEAVTTVKSILSASGLPLIVFGPGQAE